MQSSYEQPWTLSQLQWVVGNTLRSNSALSGVWVQAEMSDVRLSGGHCYMELLEKNERGATISKLRAIIWSNTFQAINRRFYNATGQTIRTGLKVLVCGSVTYHELYGMSFVISNIDPNYTLGDMERIRREILQRLQKEGLNEVNRKLVLSDIPQRIAVISAVGAAGFGDFMNQLENNADGFKIYTMLFSAAMQGDRTVQSVLDALEMVEHTAPMARWDCVVIIRGGGATTDLNSFDNYELARRVATFPLPVIVGIGHDRDRNVLDELANVSCKTPTAVAEFIIHRLQDSLAHVDDLCRRIGQYVSLRMKGEHLRLNNAEVGLPGIVKARTMRARIDLERLASRVGNASSGRSRWEFRNLDRLATEIVAANRLIFSNSKNQLERIEGLLRVLSPDNTLKRGYSITRINGYAVKDASRLSAGDVIETTLSNGVITSKVE